MRAFDPEPTSLHCSTLTLAATRSLHLRDSRNDSGIVRPSALAVVRLIMSLELVRLLDWKVSRLRPAPQHCCPLHLHTGRSTGVAPLRMRPAKVADLTPRHLECWLRSSSYIAGTLPSVGIIHH
jgi:hypothetical protein